MEFFSKVIECLKKGGVDQDRKFIIVFIESMYVVGIKVIFRICQSVFPCQPKSGKVRPKYLHLSHILSDLIILYFCGQKQSTIGRNAAIRIRLKSVGFHGRGRIPRRLFYCRLCTCTCPFSPTTITRFIFLTALLGDLL